MRINLRAGERLTDLDCDAEGERHGDEDEDEGDEGEDGRADPRALLVGCKKRRKEGED